MTIVTTLVLVLSEAPLRRASLARDDNDLGALREPFCLQSSDTSQGTDGTNVDLLQCLVSLQGIQCVDNLREIACVVDDVVEWLFDLLCHAAKILGHLNSCYHLLRNALQLSTLRARSEDAFSTLSRKLLCDFEAQASARTNHEHFLSLQELALVHRVYVEISRVLLLLRPSIPSNLISQTVPRSFGCWLLAGTRRLCCRFLALLLRFQYLRSQAIGANPLIRLSSVANEAHFYRLGLLGIHGDDLCTVELAIRFRLQLHTWFQARIVRFGWLCWLCWLLLLLLKLGQELGLQLGHRHPLIAGRGVANEAYLHWGPSLLAYGYDLCGIVGSIARHGMELGSHFQCVHHGAQSCQQAPPIC
mmetsp:Transcript_29941/g.54541  ORF Transcript_29941/g.54541 Transcript_29941/m.54541 type:complete len:360 (-) Transcript_29941:24-1103(-)